MHGLDSTPDVISTRITSSSTSTTTTEAHLLVPCQKLHHGELLKNLSPTTPLYDPSLEQSLCHQDVQPEMPAGPRQVPRRKKATLKSSKRCNVSARS